MAKYINTSNRKAVRLLAGNRALWMYCVSVILLGFIGCSRREAIGSGYVLITPQTWNPDSHPATALYFNGKRVWANVYGGGRGLKDDVLIFSSPVPAEGGGYDYSVSPQVFAIRGEGPPILLSERILNDSIYSKKNYRVWQIVKADQGLRVEFEFWNELGEEAHLTNGISWAEIRGWVEDTRGALRKNTPLGSYDILPLGSASTYPRVQGKKSVQL
jgi:hypothetical protein